MHYVIERVRNINYLFDRKGSALLIALMILFIFLALGFAVTAMTSSEIKISSNHLKSTQAFYLAEAGIAEAINVLLFNPSASGLIIKQMPIDNGKVTVTGSWSGNEVTLEAVGAVGSTQRTVKKTLRIIVGTSLFSNAITTFAKSNENWFELQNGVKITGDIRVGVNLGIANNVIVNGILYTIEEPSYNNSSVNVVVAEELELPVFPEIPEWQKPADLGQPKVYEYVNRADLFNTGDKYYQADIVELNDNLELNNVYIECSYLKLTGTKYSGITFIVDGAIDIESNDIDFQNVNLIAKDSIKIEGNNINYEQGIINTKGALNVTKNNGQYSDVQIFSHGYVFFSQNTTITRGTIISNKAITLENNFNLLGHILAKGWLDVGNNTIVNGSLSAGGLVIGNNSVITNDQDTGAPIPPTISMGVEITKLNWSEGK